MEEKITPVVESLPKTAEAVSQTVKDAGSKIKNPKNLLLIVCGVVIIVGLGWYFFSQNAVKKPVAQTPTAESESGVLTIGENIDEDGLEADQKEFQPFIDYLVSKLADQGITKGKFVGTNSVSEMAKMVREDKIDIVVDSAFPVFVVDKLAGAKPLADRWKGGAETYHTVIFVKQNSPIKTLDDLKGKIIGFDSPTSTVGYFLPKAVLIKQGYTLTQKNSPTDPVSPNEIGYVIVHDKVYEDVANGVTDAGAESELEVKDFFGDKISNYRFITTSPDIPRFLVATRGDLNPKLRTSIENVLFNMDQSNAGRVVLDSFAKTAKFTSITDSDAAYGVVKDLTDIVEEEIIKP